MSLIEVCERESAGTTRLINIATRGFIGVADNVLIGGIVITGSDKKKLVIRAKGPSMIDLGVAGALADPEIILLSGASVMDSNND
ncbi:MAG: hypothetical protein ACI9FB_002162 [Candidatus Azotimanducaceae bacterium]|jgi:hypothetical protein